MLDPVRFISCTAFTRPANTTAYADKDLVANSATNTAVVPIAVQWQGSQTSKRRIMVRRAGIFKSDPSITNAQFRVHLFAPTFPANLAVTGGDNAALAPLPAAAGDYFGSLDVTCDRLMKAGAMGWGSPSDGSESEVFCEAQWDGSQSPPVWNLQALIEAKAAYTPASGETFQLFLQGLMLEG